MRVLHVIPAVAPRYGGPSGAVVSMCVALRSAGVDAMIATTDADGTRRLPVPLGEETSYGTVPTIFFRRRWSEAYKTSPALSAWLRENLRRFDIVHVHAVFNHPCVAAGRAARSAGVPYVVRPLGTLDPWSLRQKALRKRIFWLVAGRRLVAGAAAVHYTTEREKELAESALGLSNGVVIPNGVEDAFSPADEGDGGFRARTGIPDGAPYVLTLSRLHPKKAVEILIESFARTMGRVPDAVLVIAGDGEPEYVASLRERAARLCPPGRVRFTGWLSGGEKLAALRGAAVFALTSRQENFGIAAAEAMACGTPVIVGEDVNLAGEISAADAGWVTPLASDAVGTALEAALASPEEAARRGRAAALLVDTKFRWLGVAAHLVELYKRVASSPSGH